MDNVEKLKKALPELAKKYGAQLSIDSNREKVRAISSGSLNLDDALGVKGFVPGRIYEIFGPESSGKSTLCLHAIKEFQMAGEQAAYIDSEHAFDPDYARAIGVDVDKLIFSQPDSAENALNIMYDLINTDAFGLVVLDSVAAMVPQKELEGEIGDSSMGVIARLMSQSLRKIVPAAATHNTCCLFVNQIRNKIGVMYGSPITTPGGEAMKFASSVRMEISKSVLKDGDDIYGNKTKVKVIKNKLAAPFKVAEFDVLYGVGIDRIGEVLDQAIKLNIVNKAGAWLAYKELKIQGLDKFKQLMADNEDLTNELCSLVKSNAA